jgi:PKD repeat protein
MPAPLSTPSPTPRPTPQPTAADNPPTAILNVTPVGGGAPLHVTANASSSWDRDATGIVSYQFNWGDGLMTALQASPTATHLYNVSGTYRLTVIVVDSAGLWSTASTIIKVG